MDFILILIISYFSHYQFVAGFECKCPGEVTILNFKIYEKERINSQEMPPLLLEAPEAKVLSHEPDSQITCIKIDELKGVYLNGNKCLVAKDVFSSEYFEDKNVDKEKKIEMEKTWGKWTRRIVKTLEHIPFMKFDRKIAKPMFMVRHELNIFKQWAPNEENSPIIHLIESAIREHSVVILMELGKPLPSHLEHMWKKKDMSLKELKIEIMEMIVQLAKTLDGFHKKALHLHLKPGNWAYVQRNGKEELKLIDFQNSIQFDRLRELIPDYDEHKYDGENKERSLNPKEIKKNENGDNNDKKESLEEMGEFLCNSLWNERGLPKLSGAITADQRPSTFESPEHLDACNQLYIIRKKKSMDKNQKDMEYAKQLKRITVKSEIWSLGILIVEILAQTPILMENAKIISYRTKGLGFLFKKDEKIKKIAENFFILREIFVDGNKELRHKEQRKIADELKKKMEENFKDIYELLQEIIVYEPEKRPKLDVIIGKMKANLAKEKNNEETF